MAAARPPAAKDFDIVLSTGKWEFVITPISGLTVYERKDFAGVIYVATRQSPSARLDTFVHETLHASLPSMSEAEVERVAGDVAKVLWKAGYRR